VPRAPIHGDPRPAAIVTHHDPERTWLLLRRDAYRYEGTITAWSGLQNSAKPAVDVKGWGGEFFRRGNAKQFRAGTPLSVDDLAERFIHYHQRHDPLEVLQPEEAERQREWVKQWVYHNAERVRLDLLPEKFYVDHRLGHWSGPLLQFTPLRVSVNPLLTRLAAEKNIELSTTARASERFHFEVMRRAAPELVSIPFFDDTWAPELTAADGGITDVGPRSSAPRSPAPHVVARPAPVGRTRSRAAASAVRNALRPARRPPRQRPRSQNPGWQLMTDDKHEIVKLFTKAKRRTDMGDICDMKRLIRVARDADRLRRTGEVKELFSCIGTAITLLGETEPVLDRPPKVRGTRPP
jgi:hypothetical protein